ncbi:MAG: alpha/beta-hydrolase family protein [Gordonia sp. (in: high G+C Gram-positive bacteria)]|uniref:alpha/beta hydrolase n=1 Tax=Gordonia sp. (in: high G+C Gram-positive bacteria) TaxID=84139 RepID=UPI0039E2E817
MPTTTRTPRKPLRDFREHMSYWSYGGLVGATILLLASMTPSLLPRSWYFQAVISGGAAAVGYGLGVFITWLARYMIGRDEPWPRPQKFWWWGLAFVAAIDAIVMAYWCVHWQNQIRDLMSVERLGNPLLAVAAMLALTLVVFLLFVYIGKLWARAVVWLVRLLRSFIPARIATVAGGAIALVLTVMLVNGVLVDNIMKVLNSSFAAANNETKPDTVAPTSPLRSGGPGSTVSWSSLGREGRTNMGTGPTVEQLTEFNGTPAMQPIRVYAGLDTAPTLSDIADAAVRELERTGGLQRKVIAVGSSTGSGWLNKGYIDSLEYMYNGDSALVSMQYSYLPSWISFLVDKERARQAGIQLFEKVSAKVRTLPEGQRPKLVVFGESLGSFAGESPFGSIPTIAARTDGALFSGPTFNNQLWLDTVRGREKGTPEVLPIYQNGAQVRFIATEKDLDRPNAPWTPDERLAYIQHPSDPITWFNPNLLFKQPDWLKEPRGRDVLPVVRWIPVVTFLQVSADMAVATHVPDGHGHSYLRAIPFAWNKILQPAGWTDEKTERLLPRLSTDD